MGFYDDDDDLDDRPASRRRRHDDDEDDDRAERRRRRREDDDDERDYDFRKRDDPHSGLGIASLVLGVLAGLAILIIFTIAGVMSEEAGGDLDETSPAVIALGLFAIGACGMTLVGLALGIGGLVQKDRNKLFAAIGTAVNGLVLLGSGTIMCLGALMG